MTYVRDQIDAYHFLCRAFQVRQGESLAEAMERVVLGTPKDATPEQRWQRLFKAAIILGWAPEPDRGVVDGRGAVPLFRSRTRNNSARLRT